MKKRLKFKSYPMARCGTMSSETKRLQTKANSDCATCVHISENLRQLTGKAFADAARDAIRAQGFIFSDTTVNQNDLASAICDITDVKNTIKLLGLNEHPKDNDGTEITVSDCIADVLTFLNSLQEVENNAR